MSFKQSVSILFLFFISHFIKAQTAPGIQWKKSIGQAGFSTFITAAIQTVDGRFVSVSILQDSTDNCKTVITMFGENGVTGWQKELGEYNKSSLSTIQQTSDGGYILAGSFETYESDLGTYNKCWIVKLDSVGNNTWSREYGGTESDIIHTLLQTQDGGYLIAGQTRSNDGDMSGNHGDYDGWVAKLDSEGMIQWSRCYGGSYAESINDVKQTSDGGYIYIGTTGSNNGDVSGNHGIVTQPVSTSDVWVVKTDAVGNIQWQKCFGGRLTDIGSGIELTPEGYIFSGYTSSNDGDVSGNHGNTDCWIVKLSFSADIIWQKCYGGSGAEYNYNVKRSVLVTYDGYLITASSNSQDGDVLGNSGGDDLWIVKLDVAGNMQWQKSLGGSRSDRPADIQLAKDGGYLVGGFTNSCDGDVGVCYGGDNNRDAWLIKLGQLFQVNMGDLSAITNCNQVKLNWQTQSETASGIFEIQKSSDGINFVTIASVDISGASSGTKNYKYTDNAVVDGKYFYRLSVQSAYGTGFISDTVLVVVNTQKTMLYPNPVLNEFTILPKCNLLGINLYNAEGKLIGRLPVTNNNRYTLEALPAGKYFFRLQYGNATDVVPIIKK